MPVSSLREAVEMHTLGQSRTFSFGATPEFRLVQVILAAHLRILLAHY